MCLSMLISLVFDSLIGYLCSMFVSCCFYSYCLRLFL